jgi:YbbR domain-containing protein
MSARDFARRHIFHNLGLKIISLVIATGLWLAVSSEPTSEVAFNVAIVFQNMPEHLEISSESIPSAQVRVRGPERLVRRLQASDIHEEIDLTGTKAGERTFDLNKSQVSLPDKLEAVQIVPSQIHLIFDKRVSRMVPVRPRVTGTFVSGYSIAQIKSDPENVEIIGPQKSIDAVESAITDPIDVSGLTGSTNYSRHAYVSDPLIQVADPHPVRITIIMERAPLTSAPSQSQ